LINKSILIFGYGYVTQFLTKELVKLNWKVYSTSREVEMNSVRIDGKVIIYNFSDTELNNIIENVDFIISSIPPLNGIDPVLDRYGKLISKSTFQWVGYLSTTGVYGNYNGEWVNEGTPCIPTHGSTNIRLEVERLWMNLFPNESPVNIFRLSAIYGPNKNFLEQLNQGRAHTIVKHGQYFSRIHVTDICLILLASMMKRTKYEIYNVSDSLPEQLHIVHNYAAKLLNKGPLRSISYDDCSLPSQA
jgi:hypothetical protein